MLDVHKTYDTGAGKVNALRGISVEVAKGSFTAVMGPSGSGKSTFLHCAAGLDRPTEGDVLLGGTSLAGMSQNALSRLRRERVGFVFQAYNLLSALSVQDNITMPLRLGGVPVDHEWADQVVRQVGIHDRLHHRPNELSGGQQQRVALARALITRPHLVLADEPTGALDSHTSTHVLELLRSTVHSLGQTVLMVTHDPVAASYAQAVLFLEDGLIADSLHAPTPETVAARMSGFGSR